MMNPRTRKPTIPLILTLFCVFTAAQAVFAEEPEENCRRVKGVLAVVFGPGASTGTVTNGGILNGSVAEVFTGRPLPTPDPTVVAFSGDSTITTRRGVLQTHNIYIFDVSTALATAMYRVDPVTSTGVFAGATGVIYLNSISPSGATGRARLSGRICFSSKQDADTEDDDLR